MNPTVSDVFRELLRRPVDVVVRNWNWKSAVVSSSIRAVIFLFSSLSAGWHAALGAVFVEFLFRPWVSGVLGALTQAFRFARPVWAANLTLVLLLPGISHIIEFLVHWACGTPNLATGIFWSICFSQLSTLMNVYMMRRGVLVVNVPDAGSLASDLARLPVVIGGFFAAGPRALIRWLRTRRTNSDQT